MNDNELCTVLRESVAEVRSATPVGRVISRGRTLRARRRAPVVAGAVGLAACAGLAGTALVSAGHVARAPDAAPASAGHPAKSGGVRLTAWTVAKQANGDIDVTISQLKDPAGLQATLRADGLPATVSFSGPLRLSPGCQAYNPANTSAVSGVAQIHGDHLVIDPAALPSGTGLAIFDEPGAGQPSLPGGLPTLGRKPAAAPSIPGLLRALGGPLAIGMVYASQQCTG
jgi:hypothetical protein